MATVFRVEADELGLVAKELGEATSRMGGAMHALERTVPQVTGEQSLDMACAMFAEDWKFGLKQLNETLHAIAQGLEATARAYRETDQVIRESMTGKGA